MEKEVIGVSISKKERMRPQWWERNIDRYFRMLEGRQDRCRDPRELQKEMASDANRIVGDREAYADRWQKSLEDVSKRMSRSLSGDAPLWTPLPTWQSWKRKEREMLKRRAMFERDTRLVDGRVVRGGLIPGGGRVYMTMEERRRRGGSAYVTAVERRRQGGSAYMTMEERKRQPSVYMTMEERRGRKRGKSAFMTMEEKLAFLERRTGRDQRRRREEIEEQRAVERLRSEGRARSRGQISALKRIPDKKPPLGGWVPKAVGKLGSKFVNEMWEAGYREASREAIFSGWEKVGKTLGKVKGGSMYE